MGKKSRTSKAAPSTRATILEPSDWAGYPAEWGTAWNMGGTLTEKVAIVYACVERVASALSSMDLQVSRDAVPEPPKPWLRNPSPDMYTHIGDAIGEIVWSLLMRGNAYLFASALYAPDPQTGKQWPAEWFVLNPDKVSWEDDRRRFVNSDTGQGISGNRLTHIRHMTRPGQRIGAAPLDAAAMNLTAVADYERVASKLARNSGLPTQGMLHTDQEISETTAQRYKDKWQARGDGEVAVLGAGLRYESLALNPRDLALLELREFDGRQIATVFGVPPFMVNLAMGGDLTYSTTQGMMDFFWRQTLRPMAYNIGRALGTMLPSNARTVVFDSDAYTRGTMTEHVAMLVQASGGPIISTNEARASIGLAPLSLPDQPARVTA